MFPLFGFLLVLARVGGSFALVPLPHVRSSPATPRIVLTLAMTMSLRPVWPVVEMDLNSTAAAWRLAWLLGGEAAFGTAVGVVVSMLLECFLFAAQILGLQAGYGYASTIDPTTEADSGVLLLVAQLAGWLLFLAFDMERHVVRALARSLESYPAGLFALTAEARAAVLGFGSTVLSTAMRLALPVVALLLLVDVAFAFFGKLNAQLQLLSLAFPVKMLVALVMLAAGSALFPRVYEGLAAGAAGALFRLSGRP